MQSKITNLAEQFEVRTGHAFAALVGCVSLDQAADAVTRAIVAARDRGIRRLLVDASQLAGFPSPTLADRYFIVRRWVTEAAKQVELSIVLQQHILDPDRFGIIVATNLGMRADAFSLPSEALTWLLSGRPAGVIASTQKPNPGPAQRTPSAVDETLKDLRVTDEFSNWNNP